MFCLSLGPPDGQEWRRKDLDALDHLRQLQCQRYPTSRCYKYEATLVRLLLNLFSRLVDVEQSYVRFLGNLILNLWDCGGQEAFMESYFSTQKDNIFKNVEVLIYVFDVQSAELDKVIEEREREDRLSFIDGRRICITINRVWNRFFNIRQLRRSSV